ncbi:MAG: hypothetical protein IPP18_00690 [Rhodocyclaceae bacterium]|nr:hypothetical protein [Rhodocyclaceae bacterium]
MVAVIMAPLAISIGMSSRNNLVAWFRTAARYGSRHRDEPGARRHLLGYVVVDAGKAEFMKRPEAMRWIEVCSARSKRCRSWARPVLRGRLRQAHQPGAATTRRAFDVVPETADTISQYLFLFSISAKPADSTT